MGFLKEDLHLSERRACRLVGVSRSFVQYCRRPSNDQPLRDRMKELAAENRRCGYKRLHVLLHREGLVINHMA